jgi:geranylgeranyl diphosphate synthase type II
VAAGSIVEHILERYRQVVIGRLVEELPHSEPAYFYDLIPYYPSLPGKAIRPALCLAVCEVLDGDANLALNTAIAIELFHNAFLIQDDVQDGSERRRGAATLHRSFGTGIAINAGSMTSLIGLQRLLQNRWLLGDSLTWRIFQETELMMRHSLEGQAIELGWIRDNRVDLTEDDYYRMCLKKTSWYTCVYPCRLGTLIGKGGVLDVGVFDSFGWYLGAAFQIQDDILNLVGRYDLYGKEIGGDLWEGKRTLMLIHLLRTLRGPDRVRLTQMLGRVRSERNPEDVRWVADCMREAGCIEHARSYARQLAEAARAQAIKAFGHLPSSDARELLLALPDYVVERNH